MFCLNPTVKKALLNFFPTWDHGDKNNYSNKHQHSACGGDHDGSSPMEDYPKDLNASAFQQLFGLFQKT